MSKLCVVLDGWNEREDPYEVETKGSVWDGDIGDLLKQRIQQSGDPPPSEMKGEYKIDDGPWKKWSAEPEYDYNIIVRADGL